MSHFHRVEGAHSGPEALGILVPPGARTLVILRPRAIEVDLLPIRATLRDGLGSGFLDQDRAAALALAEQLGRMLEDGAAGGANMVGPIPAASGTGYWVQAEVGTLTLLACDRRPGRPYEARTFADLPSARAAAATLRRYLCPAPGSRQDLYFNVQSFGS